MTGAGLVDAALHIGRNLCGSAQPAEGGRSWTSSVVLGIDGDRAVVGAGEIGPSLYDGSAGVAWALAACAQATSESRFADTSLEAIRHALTTTDAMLDADRLGLFDGTAGVAWAAAVVGHALDDDATRRRGGDLAKRIRDRLDAATPPRDETDLIGGTAGILLGLSACASMAPAAAADLHGRASARQPARTGLPRIRSGRRRPTPDMGCGMADGGLRAGWPAVAGHGPRSGRYSPRPGGNR